MESLIRYDVEIQRGKVHHGCGYDCADKQSMIAELLL